MFDIGWSEILVIAIVAIVVIGPKDLPRVMRLVGQWTGKMKRMAREFQGQFNEALREAELDGVKKEIADIGKMDPLAGVRDQMRKLDTGLRKDLMPTPLPPPPGAAPPPPPVPPSVPEAAPMPSAEPVAKDAT